VATYTVHTEVPGGAIYTNAAEVTPPSGVVDPDLSNNSSEQSTYCIILFPVMMHDMAGTP